MLQSILNALDAERQTVIDLQTLLVSTVALGPENGGEGERVKADKIKAFIAPFGLSEITEYNAPDLRVPCGHRPNMALILDGQDRAHTFWIVAHMDVVPAGDPALWKTPPYQLTVEGDTLIGRGVEDNHHGLVAATLLAKAVKQSGAKPPINLGVLFVADEETGNKFGLDYMVRHHGELFKPDDLFLVPDSGLPTSEQIEVAEKSVLWLKVCVHGQQCHASTPEKGVNTLKAAADFIMKTDALKAKFGDVNELFRPPCTTIEPTKIEANVPNVNMIPGADTFFFDCRILPHYSVDDVLDAIKQAGAEVEAAHGVTISYEIMNRADAAPVTPTDSDIVRRLSAAITAEYGITPHPQGIGGGTVAACLRNMDRNVVVWATIFHNPHTSNERASITNMIRDAKVMARVLWG